MSFNKNVFYKGVRYLTGTLPLMILGPVLIDNSQKNLQSNFHYYVLIVGIICCFFAVYLLFLGTKTIVSSIFEP